MRICLLSKMFPPVVGGSGLYAHEIADALGARGHDVDVYTQSSPDEEGTVETNENVTVHTLAKARRYLVTFETLYFSARARIGVDFDDYDVIHGTLMPASTIALSDRLSFDTPIVVTSHGTSIDETLSHKPEVPTDYLKRYLFHPTNVVFDSIAGRTADRIIGISSDTCRRLSSFYRFNESKISLIPHGVRTERFHPSKNYHSSVDPDKFTLLHVGRLVSRKHIDLALKAVAAVDRHNIQLLIAGSGRHRSRLESEVQQLGIDEQVKFLGYVPDDDLPSLYASSDVFLFLSRYEGFGLTFLEAMASGTPVIGTAVGGFPDLVTDGEEGIVVDRDARSVARSIDKLAGDPDLLDRLSKQARILAERHTWNKVARETEEVYSDLIV